MNIAYLDPPYSRYFHALAGRIAHNDGGSVVALLSCPAYRMYTGRDRNIVWCPGTTQKRHEVPQTFARAEWAHINDPEFIEAFSHAVEWFKYRFIAERIDTCLVFSDARPFSVAAQLAARETGVVCVFFERGAFRLRTSSLSTQGVNARFDLRVAALGPAISGMSEADLPQRRPFERWLRLRFLIFLVRNALSRARQPGRALMQHKRYHVFNYLRIAIKQFQSEHPDLPAHHEPEPPLGAAPVVLLPLQLPTDSQFVMYSPFKHNQELIDFVVAGVRQAVPDALVLVKLHPMDVRTYRLPEGARFIDGSLTRFYRHAAFVVCLNSNVGFEAAIRGKRVLCFADSFYTSGVGRGCVIKGSCANFSQLVREAIRAPDATVEGEQLKEAVFRYYQAPGDAWAYTTQDIQVSSHIVMQHVHAVRRSERAPIEQVHMRRSLAEHPIIALLNDEQNPDALQVES